MFSLNINMVFLVWCNCLSSVEHLALCCPWKERNKVIADVVQVYSGAHGRTMIFTQTKKDANELGLNDTLKQDVQVLHGDIAQKQVWLNFIYLLLVSFLIKK